MTQASRLIPGILLGTVTEQIVVLMTSVFFCQKIMIWRGQLVILQMLELFQNGIAHTQSEDKVTGKVTGDQQLKLGLVSEDIPLVNYLEATGHMKITLGIAAVISLVQEKDEPVLSLDYKKDKPVISLDHKKDEVVISLVMK
jgi:hypothetical protein